MLFNDTREPDTTVAVVGASDDGAVRKGDFKLLSMPKPFGTGDWQLYDLKSDPGELNDLSSQRPKLRDEMAELWDEYARETGVIIPIPSPLSIGTK